MTWFCRECFTRNRAQLPSRAAKSRKSLLARASAWKEYVVVSAKDIPGKNCIALILDDQPCLAADSVNHPEEPFCFLLMPTVTSSEKRGRGCH